MSTTQNHTINIDDTTANWLNWGNLVLKWVNKQQALPKNVGELKAQWAKEPTPIQGKINSPDSRGLNFVVYSIDPKDAITIPLPDPTMVQADNDTLRKLTQQRHEVGALSPAVVLPGLLRGQTITYDQRTAGAGWRRSPA